MTNKDYELRDILKVAIKEGLNESKITTLLQNLESAASSKLMDENAKLKAENERLKSKLAEQNKFLEDRKRAALERLARNE